MSPAVALLIHELRRSAQRAADEAIRANGRAFADLTDADRLRTEAIARAVAMRLLENAFARVESLDAGGAALDLDVVRELFGLSDAAQPGGHAARAS